MTPFQRGQLFEGRLINGAHQDLILPVDKGEMPTVDCLHRPELHHPLVSCLEPSEGWRAKDLEPCSFPFRKILEIGITRRGESWYSRRGT